MHLTLLKIYSLEVSLCSIKNMPHIWNISLLIDVYKHASKIKMFCFLFFKWRKGQYNYSKEIYHKPYITVVGWNHFRKWWCFWLSSWPHRYLTLATVPFNLLWVFGLTQGPEMTVALGRWVLKEVICQKPLTQLPLRCDLSLSPGPRHQLVSHLPCEIQFPLTAFPFNVYASEQPLADCFSGTWSADVRWAFVNFRGLLLCWPTWIDILLLHFEFKPWIKVLVPNVTLGWTDFTIDF